MFPLSSSTTPPPKVRIINGYVTVDPPLTHQEQRRRMEIYATERHHSPPASSTPPNSSSAQPALVYSSLTLSCILAWLLSHMLFTSWPQDSIISQTDTADTSASTQEQWNVPDKQGMAVSTYRKEVGDKTSWGRTILLSASTYRAGSAPGCPHKLVTSQNVWNKLSAMTQAKSGLWRALKGWSLQTSWKYYGRITGHIAQLRPVHVEDSVWWNPLPNKKKL